MESDLYAQLDSFEQSLDTELNELRGFLHEESNETQEGNDIDDDTDGCESKGLFLKEKPCCDEVCIVKTTSTRECYGEIAFRDTFYRGGTQCYAGEVALDLQHAIEPNFNDVPVILSILQQQQNNFTPLPCDSDNDPPDTSRFLGPLHDLEEAANFVISEVSGLSPDIEKLDPDWQVYFELVGDTSSLFQDVIFACSRFYSKGQVFIFLFFEGVLYATVQNHDNDLGLLDVDFLAYFTGCKEGSMLAMYNDATWMKLSAWKRAQRRRGEKLVSYISPKSESNNATPLLEDLISDGYVQSYSILKPDKQGKEREVLFRFGSWLYQGGIEFVSSIHSPQDIPRVIREMRLAQHQLEFVGDVSSYSVSNRFFKWMQYSTRITKLMEEQAASCEKYLCELIVDKEGKDWLDDDATLCFFEFACCNDGLEEVELVCNKVYNARGYITISMYQKGKWYLVLQDTRGENPLLDSKFPDVSDRIDGYQLKTYPHGHETWTELRSLSVWKARLNTDIEKNPIDKGSTMPEEVIRKERKLGSLRSLIPLRRK